MPKDWMSKKSVSDTAPNRQLRHNSILVLMCIGEFAVPATPTFALLWLLVFVNHLLQLVPFLLQLKASYSFGEGQIKLRKTFPPRTTCLLYMPIYDPYLETWTRLNPAGTPPSGVFSGACVATGHHLYTYGGQDTSGSCPPARHQDISVD